MPTWLSQYKILVKIILCNVINMQTVTLALPYQLPICCLPDAVQFRPWRHKKLAIDSLKCARARVLRS